MNKTFGETWELYQAFLKISLLEEIIKAKDREIQALRDNCKCILSETTKKKSKS